MNVLAAEIVCENRNHSFLSWPYLLLLKPRNGSRLSRSLFFPILAMGIMQNSLNAFVVLGRPSAASEWTQCPGHVAMTLWLCHGHHNHAAGPHPGSTHCSSSLCGFPGP